VRGDRRFGRIGRRNPRRDAVHGGAALDVAPHIGLLRRLVGEGYVFHLLQDHEQMKRPPAEADAARTLHLGKPHHAEIRIGASQGEKEIDVIGRHDATSRLSGLVGIVEWRGFPFNGRTPLIPIHARTGEESMLRMALWPAVALALTCSTAMASDIRRVVTGLDANNKAVVLFDGRLPLAPGPYGLASTNMWITESY